MMNPHPVALPESSSSKSNPAKPLGHVDAARGNCDRRFDVQFEESTNGERQVVLRELSWGQGLGWYVQKTLSLDTAQVDALLGALCCAKQKLDSDRDPTLVPCSLSSCGASGPGSSTDDKIVSIETLLRTQI